MAVGSGTGAAEVVGELYSGNLDSKSAFTRAIIEASNASSGTYDQSSGIRVRTGAGVNVTVPVVEVPVARQATTFEHEESQSEVVACLKT